MTNEMEAMKELDYGITMAVQTLVQALGMFCENQQHPQDQPYTKKDFDALIEKNGVYHNAQITRWERLY
jgi:hypothetical protein